MSRGAVAQGGDHAPAKLPCTYEVDVEQLTQANEDKDMEFYARVGRAEGLAKLLASSPDQGLNPDVNASGVDSVAEHRRMFGSNTYAEVPPKNFFRLVWEVIQDPILILLIAAAAVSTILGAAIPEERAANHWVEGVAIWVAVILVTLVGAGNDYSKDLQFKKLNAQKDMIKIKVIRGGGPLEVANTDLVVGDVVILEAGDKVVADALLLEGHSLTMDEASLTGESEPMKKNLMEDPWVMSGTKVTEGGGHVLVIAVGPNSTWGKTMALVSEAGDDDTPLQQKLAVLATAIGKVGLAVAICCFVAQLIKWCVVNNGFPIKKINDNGPIQFFLYAITIIVVAVPEGLPLAVTISLAYSTKKMLADQNFVRVLSACETMGGATAICSDKTGTLTENRMTVVQGWFGGKKTDHAPTPSEVDPVLLEELKINIAMNSTAFISKADNGAYNFTGNRTDCALLMYMERELGCSYSEYRLRLEKDKEKVYGFSSSKKMASVLLRQPDKYRLYNKGAAEWVLKRCNKCCTEAGVVDMTPEMCSSLLDVVTDMAKSGLRCICLTYADFPLVDPSRKPDFFDDADNVDDNLTCMCIVGIKDPVRPEVPDAVRTCKRAGITVRMVTGDNIHTARHIARECGILYDMGPGKPEHTAMEGPVFREMLKEEGFMALRTKLNEGDKEALTEIRDMIGHIRVLARSSPEDKLQLVRLLKELGDVVAVTGDGTNDAPALKESDVGLAMGQTGTEVAKEAADIVILDDNFSSIVKSVLWGRSVFANIRKFLQFQLTVNLVALVTAFVGAVVGGHEPLNILQLLWVNLIMDTMGALALATEDPHPALLLQRPNGRTEHLINWRMAKHIFVQGSYQMIWMFLCLYYLPTGPKGLERYKVDSEATYYSKQCYGYAIEVLPGQVNITDSNLGASATFTCNVLTGCGFPYTIAGVDCTLAADWAAYGQPMPTNDVATAVCLGPYGAANTQCDRNTWVQTVQGKLDDEWSDYNNDQYKSPLSLLFNIFICAQVVNEINSRRINDEYTIFSGFFTNYIFVSVIVLTMGFQAIIINFLGLFFKVQPLDWKEWLASIAIGLGAFPLSLLTRFISRNLECCVRFEQQLPPDIDDPALVREMEVSEQQAHGNGHAGDGVSASIKAADIEAANGSKP